MTQPVAPPQPTPPGYAGTVSFVALEAALTATVLAAFTAWLGLVSGMVLAAFTAHGSPPDPTAVWRAVPEWRRQVDRIMAELLPIAKQGWDDTMAQLGLDIPFNKDDPTVVDSLARTRNLMVRTPDEVYRSIASELGRGADLGESNEQLAARVRSVLDVTGTENWPARANVVAVTEVHRAYNMGAQAAGQKAQQRFQPALKKTWVSKDDSRVRPGHRAADGQTVAVGQPFQVSGEALIAPGDPSGQPWNVINCRCKMRFTWGVTRGR